jgi:cold shock protein
MMTTGTVKSFNASKDYGFIRMDTGGSDVSVHCSAVRKAGFKASKGAESKLRDLR